MECQHEHFAAEVDVTRLEDSGRFQADVRIKCRECGLPFRFIGLPAGLDFNGAATSIDATEARLAIAPKGEVVSVLEGGVVGFFSEERVMSEGSIDLLTHKRDGSARHPSIAGVLKHFRYAHLPEHLQGISRPCAELAIQMAETLPENPDLTCGLRDLLTAKDNFVRARL